MRKLDQYLIREMIVPFFIGTFVIVLMFQANAYMFVAKNYNLDYVPLAARFQYILYSTPQYMEMTLPVGSAFAASLMMTRLARESELTAMRAAGVRISRVVLPVALFGIVAGVGNYFVVERIMPPATRKANSILNQTSMLGMTSSLTSNAFLKLGKYAVSLGTVQRDRQTELLTVGDAMLIEKGSEGVTTIIYAPSGTYDRGVWTFPNARLYAVHDIDITPIAAKTMVINERIVVDQLWGPPQQQEVSTPRLREMIRDGRKTGSDVKGLEVELYKRFAVPASCAVFAFAAPIFAVLFARSGGFTGVLASMGMVVVYYNAFIISTDILGKTDHVPAWLAAWLPNIVFGLLAIFGYRRLE